MQGTRGPLPNEKLTNLHLELIPNFRPVLVLPEICPSYICLNIKHSFTSILTAFGLKTANKLYFTGMFVARRKKKKKRKTDKNQENSVKLR